MTSTTSTIEKIKTQQQCFLIRTSTHELMEIDRSKYVSDADFYTDLWKYMFGIDINKQSKQVGIETPFCYTTNDVLSRLRRS